MPLLLLTTPAARLRTLIALGLVALAVAIGWAVQPATGPTLDILDWRPFSVHSAIWVALGAGIWRLSHLYLDLGPSNR